MTVYDFKNALRDRIERMTNILTVTDRFMGKAERGYALLVSEKESRVIDGGRQLERRFEVSVVIFSNTKEWDGTMKKRLYDSIFPYFEIGDRHFVPLDGRDTKKEGYETITFDVEFCDTLDREEADIQLMGNITLNIISGGANGITGNSHQL